MTAKTCPFCSIALTKNNRCTDPDFAGCELCFEEAGLENEHQDGFHDEEAKAECPMCPNYVNPRRPVATRKGHSNTAPHSHSSHGECYAKGTHPATPAGRAACRKRMVWRRSVSSSASPAQSAGRPPTGCASPATTPRRETEGMFFEDDGNPVPVEYCDWCHWRLRKRTPATWRSTGDEVDVWCTDHVGHAVNPVERINRKARSTGETR